MSRPLTYREHRPSGALTPFVECYWTSRGDAPPGSPPGRVLPDGCSDVLFDLEGSARVGGEARPRAWAVGTMTRAVRVSHAGAVDIVGVRFRPGAARTFLSLAASEITDGWVDADLLWGAEAGELWERMADRSSTGERIALLDRTLTGRAREAGARTDRVVLRAAGLLAGGPRPAPGARPRPTPAVADVADRLGCSRRHLERRFRDDVGIPPGALRRVGRLRRAAALIAGTGCTLGAVAARAGYHDQAHMGRDFVALAGVTPGEYRRERGAVETSTADPSPDQGGDPVASVQDADAPTGYPRS